jgi:hypothetical protein
MFMLPLWKMAPVCLFKRWAWYIIWEWWGIVPTVSVVGPKPPLFTDTHTRTHTRARAPSLPDEICQKLTAAVRYTSSQVWCCYHLQFFQEFKLMLLAERATLRNVPLEQDLQTVVSLSDRF